MCQGMDSLEISQLNTRYLIKPGRSVSQEEKKPLASLQLLARLGIQTTCCLWGKRNHGAKDNNPAAASGDCKEPSKPERMLND